MIYGVGVADRLFPDKSHLVNEEVSVINGTTVWTCSIRHPKLHKLIEASALLAMRDSDSDYASSRQYPILYLRQWNFEGRLSDQGIDSPQYVIHILPKVVLNPQTSVNRGKNGITC